PEPLRGRPDDIVCFQLRSDRKVWRHAFELTHRIILHRNVDMALPGSKVSRAFATASAPQDLRMLAQAVRRLLLAIPTLLAIVAAAFVLMHLAPGGPFTKERQMPPEIERRLLAEYNLDQPIHV